MKKFLILLSILFYTTIFANNSYADDCPAITPNTTYGGIPVKVVYSNNNGIVHAIVPQPFEYNGVCTAPYVAMSGDLMAVGLISNYPAGTSTDVSESHLSQLLEACSESEAYQMISDPTYYATLLYQSFGLSVEMTDGWYILSYQRCPVTCSAGTVLQNLSEWNQCVSCPNDRCCLTESTTYTLSDYRNLDMDEYLCPAPSPLRISRSTNNASATSVASGAYAKGAYNANVANINNAIGYVEESSIATINAAKVSANNMNLSVNGFTPSGTVNVNSNSATINGSFNVPTTVAMFDTWGADTTTNGTLGGIQPANITNGSVSGIDATFTGTASGDLSGTGSFSNASVHVDGWVADNPE